VTTVRVLERIAEVAPAAWNALVRDESPFLEWEWLASLEESGSVAAETGWLPQHLTLWEDDRLVGACPLYVKGHSMGEFVFDHGWADAAERAGIRYYPKLLVAVPFTPVSGARFLSLPGGEDAVLAVLPGVVERIMQEQGFSSAHVNFCRPSEVAALTAHGWLRRTGYQYHWVNDGYDDFDGYLAGLRSKRRNQVRREQRELAEQEVEISALTGDAVGPELVPTMYALYRTTVDQHTWGKPYLNERFFALLVERFRSRICFIVAKQGGRIIAGTFNVQKGDALYGRYWGAFLPLRHLHFNVCYYAAIDHGIRHGLQRFEPGAGGEYKHLRGFDARPTESMHLLRDPRLRDAVARYLERERAAVHQDIDWLGTRTALKRG